MNFKDLAELMKRKSVLSVMLLGAVALSGVGCRSTLCVAGGGGDVQAVKQELEQGANPDGKAPMANLLWQIPTSLVTIPLDMVRTVAFPTLIWPIFDPLYYYDDQGKMKYDTDKYLTKGVFAFSSKTAADVAEELDRDAVLTELILAGGQGSEWARAKVVSEAARKGDAETLGKLLQKGIDANWGCSGDYKPLMLAIGGGHEECARVLLAHGASFDAEVEIGGKTVNVYQYACAKGQRDLYKKLGGPIITSPVSVDDKIISVRFDSAQSMYQVDRGGPWVSDESCNRPPSFFRITHKPGGNYLGQHGVRTYQKTGENTAVIECYYAEGYDKFYLTFTSPNRATATCDGDPGGDYHAIRYTNVTITFD